MTGQWEAQPQADRARVLSRWSLSLRASKITCAGRGQSREPATVTKTIVARQSRRYPPRLSDSTGTGQCGDATRGRFAAKPLAATLSAFARFGPNQEAVLVQAVVEGKDALLVHADWIRQVAVLPVAWDRARRNNARDQSAHRVDGRSGGQSSKGWDSRWTAFILGATAEPPVKPAWITSTANYNSCSSPRNDSAWRVFLKCSEAQAVANCYR